jgi:hypothetical protein
MIARLLVAYAIAALFVETPKNISNWFKFKCWRRSDCLSSSPSDKTHFNRVR